MDPVTLGLLAIGTMTVLRPRWKWPAEAEPFRALIEQAATDHQVPRDILARTLYEESRFRPDIIDGRVRSPVGAMGIAQFMPATARELGIDALDPAQAIPGAARYLRQQYVRFGTWRLALVSYNWGPGNVARALAAQRPLLQAAQGYADRILKEAT